MAPDHSRLGLENKFFENKSGRIFCFRPVYFKKSCQEIWVRVNQPFISFIHHIWGETVPWDVVFTRQTSDKNAVFHNCSRQIALIQYSEPSKQAWTFSDTRSKNFQNHLYGYRFSLLTSANFAVNIKRITLQHNKEFIVFILYLMVL